MSKVALIRCESYDYDEVKKSIEKGLSLLGGLSLFVKKGENILLKPNMLIGDAPEKCVTTNPVVFEIVAELFLSAGAHVNYGDSPALGSPQKVAKKTGIAEKADKLNIKLAEFKTGVDLFFEKGIQNKKFTIAKAILDNDGIISLPKLKTHGLEKFTGAVKNQFGCIPGALKGEFHVKLPNAEDFAKMLVDLNNFVNPRLYIMDGIYGMEGNGPRGGAPKKMNILLFSKDPIALDATVCRLIGVNPEYVPTIRYGRQAGTGTFLKKEIELVGDTFKSFKTNNFKINKRPLKPYKPGSVVPFLNRAVVQKPYIITEKCVKCGICVSMCPQKPKALFLKNKNRPDIPIYNYDNCIRCFCCQEICPESAIKLKTPFLRKIINLF
jgi:uncharacterized protein (DUF362 family)/NAD-dependent dihydropyrimidine dehydrogenase PreA subunit